jgi:hypothetical protein
MLVAIGATAVFLLVTFLVIGRHAMDSRSDKTYRTKLTIATVIFSAVAFWPIALAYHIGHTPQAKFTTSIIALRTLPGPANNERVTLAINNVGKAAGSPLCSVSITTNNYADGTAGFGTNNLTNTRSIPAGSTDVDWLDIVVTNNDARFTTKGDISVSNC